MQIPRFFTVAELITLHNGNPEWAKDPLVTREIYAILTSKGYTQRMIHLRGQVHRTWSRQWPPGQAKNRTLQRRRAEPDKEKIALIERIREGF